MPAQPSQLQVTGDAGIYVGYTMADDYILGQGLNVGSRIQLRQRATSPFADYGVLVNVVAEMTEMRVPVIILADSMGDLEELMVPLVLAFEQFTYTIRYKPDGLNETDVVYEWECEKADWSIGDAGEINRIHHRNFAQIVNFIVPRGKAVLGSIL